jgi:EVE domain
MDCRLTRRRVSVIFKKRSGPNELLAGLVHPLTWTRFRNHGADISGFRRRQRKAAVERVRKGDLLLCYLVKLSRWCGVLEVTSEAFEDHSPIFADTEDPFTIRFHVKPRTLLDFEKAIPIEQPELWDHLSFTRDIEVGSFGWAQQATILTAIIARCVNLPYTVGRSLSERQDRRRRKVHELY